MDEVEELIRLCGRALVCQMGQIAGFELRMTRGCVLALTGEPLPDFNMLTIGQDADAEAFFTRSVAHARERGLPLLATLSPNVAPALAPTALELGLKPVAEPPLMVLRGAAARRSDRRVRVERALGDDLVRTAGDLVAAAFDTPRDVVARCIDVANTATSGVETYVAWDEDGPASAVSVTPAGNTAAISAMATPPERQRRGVGRALLTSVIDDLRARGVERFHLIASNAGFPLYSSLGFETIANLSAWILTD